MPNKNTRRPSNQTLITSFLRSPFGALIAKPWFDRIVMTVLDRWYFPISRMWAAARNAEGSVERFLAEVDLEASASLKRKLTRLLNEFELRRTKSLVARDKWETAFFGDGPASPENLSTIEDERLSSRSRVNAMRLNLFWLGISQRISPIKWQVPTLAEVADEYDDLLQQPEKLFALPENLPKVSKSRSFPGIVGEDYWLRFESPSPTMTESVTARVHEPVGVENPPTLIYGHGICVEFDHWRGLVDEIDTLVKMGIRVIRPEAPSHGRRVQPDRFGGEHFIATSPRGPIDHLRAAVLEWAVLMDWSRQTSTGRVAVGGSSLGSMTAHLVADRARAWPNRLQPDAMLLIIHSHGVGDAMFRGKLSDTWGIKTATTQVGWSLEKMQKYITLLDTEGPTSVPAEKVVSILGTRDNVTPYDTGVALLDEWDVPAQNRFEWRRGHFSIPLTMLRHHEPLQRFVEILND